MKDDSSIWRGVTRDDPGSLAHSSQLRSILRTPQRRLSQKVDRLLPRSVRNERGEDRGEGSLKKRASSPRPSPPLHGGEGKELTAPEILRQSQRGVPTYSVAK
jgi:hypothetical protein